MSVALVGAGPGDPELITVRGLARLRACEVLVYDRLVAQELVDEAPAEALRIGLVQEVVPLGRQVDRAMELAELITQNAPLGVQVTKKAARAFIEAGEKAAIAAEAEIRGTVMNSEDAKEGIRSFVERRAAVFQGR